MEDRKKETETESFSFRWGQALFLNFMLLVGMGLIGILIWQRERSISYLHTLFTSDSFLFDFLLGMITALFLLFLLFFLHRLGLADLPKNRYTDLLRELVKKPSGPFFIALTSSISEEFLFRGVSLPLLQLLMPAWVSLVTISLLFMLLHIPQYAGRRAIHLYIFAVGLLLGLIFYWRGNLIAVIVAHFFYNLGGSYWLRRMDRS